MRSKRPESSLSAKAARKVVALVACALAAAACEGRKSPSSPEPQVSPSPEIASEPTTKAALALVERFECNRCHELEGVPQPTQRKACVGCHRKILSGDMDAEEASASWKQNLHSLNVAPSLRFVSKKYSQAWVRRFLLEPHEVRPGLPATMPRLPLTEAEATLLAEWLVPAEAPAASFPSAAAAHGASLFAELGCDSCHALGSRAAKPRALAGGDRPTVDALALAPDLSHTRSRFQAGALAGWLENPKAFDPTTLMPEFSLTRSQAEALAAFLWNSSEAPPLPAGFERLPVLERAVGWDEVNEKVFKTVCWHCHSDEEFAFGDGGAGNTGGFGYTGAGFDVSSFAAIRSGMIGPDGRRSSVFAEDESGEPRLLSVLLVRHAEEGGHSSRVVGMPLGFPALSAQQIQLVESWIAQGRPR